MIRLCATLIAATMVSSTVASPQSRFHKWKAYHLKSYRSAADETKALATYLANDVFIQKQNALNLTYTLGHNQFSDLSKDEWAARFTSLTPTQRAHSSQTYEPPANVNIPAAVDWQKAGKVTPVMNEGQCGSTWAIAAVGSIESEYAIASRVTPIELSVEQIMACDTKGGDHGCEGGEMSGGFDYVMKHPLCTAADYPYDSGSGGVKPCNHTCKGIVSIKGQGSAKTEAAIGPLVAEQPVTTGVDAADQAWQFYRSGILNSPECHKELDHAVLVVGYGEQSGTPYWRLRNQWGTSWGESGYIRIIKGKEMCGIGEQTDYPTGAHHV